VTRLPTPLRPMFPIAKRGVVAGTQIFGVLTRRLPRTEGRPGPPRSSSDSTENYAIANPGRPLGLTHVMPRFDLDRPPPVGLPAGHFAFWDSRRDRVPRAVVADIRWGRAVGDYGAVITPDDTLLFDLSPYYGVFRATQHPIYLRLRLPPITEVEGSVAVLTTRGVDNYYHFLIDVLPRLEIPRKAGAAPDRYLVNRKEAFQRELLDHMGISEARTLQSSDLPHVRAQELVVPSLPDGHLRTPPWVVPWLRERLLPNDLAAPRLRLYVTRGHRRNTRRVENEAEVLAALQPLGFKVVDPGTLSVAEQVRHFAEAEIVVGAHGAGLNVAFCPPGTAVVELFPRDYVNVCYWKLVSTVEGLRYRYLVSDSPPGQRCQQAGVASDIRVDANQLLRLVEKTLTGATTISS
jgi:capsular polysaccharide biosynthesis protein